MSSLTHRAKIRIAKRLRTHEELKARASIFMTVGWFERRKRIEARVKRNEANSRLKKEKP